YSPDSKRIAFTSNRSGSHEIWVCNSDGSNVVQLTSFGGRYFTAMPRWSPDGRSIFFHSEQEGRASTYVISSEGGRPKRLGSADPDPTGWSRDGTWIYFNSKRSGDGQIWRMPAGGGDAVQVTRKGGGNNVVESFDRRFIFYLKHTGGEDETVWKVPIEGGQEAQVLESV